MAYETKDIPYGIARDEWLFADTAFAVLRRIMKVAGDRLPEEELKKLAEIRDGPNSGTHWDQIGIQLACAIQEAKKKGQI